MNSNLFDLIIRLSKQIYPNSWDIISIKLTFKVICKMLKHNGTLWTVKTLKQSRLHITKYICGQPLLTNNQMLGLTDGFPKIFIFLKKFIDSGESDKIRFALTLMGISRTLLPKKGESIPIDYSTITSPGPRKVYTIPCGFLKKFVTDYNLISDKPYADESKLYISTKTGPNGPATLTAMETVLYLSYSQMQWIFDISRLDSWFGKFYTWCFNNFEAVTGSHKPGTPASFKTTGRLSIVKDPECKMRVIAILDYVSQVALRPIHDVLFSKLKNIPQDRTFTQDPHIKHGSFGDHKYWSLDLTAATDRLPLRLQKRLLGYIFQDNKFAESWSRLLSDREYTTQGGSNLRYAVGQPMGAYSSWAMLALTHHLIVQYSAWLEGVYPFKQYILLGDDIVIFHDAVAKRYMKVMGKLGVELSPSKSHVSYDTYEFAKRWFKGGKEITGLPLRGICQNLANPFIVYTALYDYIVIKASGYTGRSSVLTLVINLYKGKPFIKGFSKRGKPLPLKFSMKWLIPKLVWFSWGLKISMQTISYEELRRALGKVTVDNEFYVLPDPVTARSEILRIIGNGLAKSVAETSGKVSAMASKLKGFLSNLELPVADYKIHPITYGLINYIDHLHQASKDFGSDNVPLKEAINQMVFLDLDKVFDKQRSKILQLTNVGDVARVGLRCLREEKEVMYGSSTTESTYTASQSLALSIKNSTSMLRDELNDIDKVIAPVDPMAAYAALFGMTMQSFSTED